MEKQVLSVYLKYEVVIDSSLDARVEEFVDVDDILEEAPLGVSGLIRTQVLVDGGIDLGSHLELLLHINGGGLLGSHGHEGCSGEFEHF